MPPYPSMLNDPQTDPNQPPDPSVIAGQQPSPLPSMASPPDAAPQSSVPDVAPGQPIPEQEMHHAKMRDYDRRSSENSAAVIGLDWQDPNYAQKLHALQTQHGVIMADRAHEERSNPWGSMGNHPGLGGKIAHGLSVAGNIAGNALVPNLMPSIPGTQANIAEQEHAGENEIKQAGQEGLVAAQTDAANNKEAKQPTPDQAVLDAGKRIAMGQGTSEDLATVKSFHDLNNSKREKLENTQQLLADAVADAQNRGVDPNADPKVSQLKDVLTSLQYAQKPDNIDQQYNDAVQRGDTKEAERLLGVKQQLAKAGQAPEHEPHQLGITPDNKVVNLRPGDSVAPGTQTPSGFATLNRPTNQTRAMSEMADSVLKQTPKIVNEVDALAQKIGPGAGRWNEFWVNKAGIDDPDFAGLDTDLDLYASALVRTHFGARGGQQYREALRKQFSEAQSPEDLKSRIEHAEGWIKGYAEAGKQPNEKPAETNPTHTGGFASWKAKQGGQ